MTNDSGGDDPEILLWVALMFAPPEGAAVSDLMTTTGMSPWIYLRLRELTEQGHVIQVSRGRWRAVTGDVARRRQLPKVTADGAPQGEPLTQGGDANLQGIQSQASREDAPHWAVGMSRTRRSWAARQRAARGCYVGLES
jgi:hypothetical protein